MDCLRVDSPKLILRVCKILIDDAITRMDVILLGMYDIDMIPEMN